MDNNNINEDYKKMENFYENELNNINLIQKIIIIFLTDLSMIKEDILRIPNIQKGPFFILNQIFKNFIIEIKSNLVELKDFISPFNNIRDSILSSKENHLKSLKEIQSDLSKSKTNFINKKKEYLNCIKELEDKEKLPLNNNNSNIINNTQQISSEKDENIFYSSKKENYNQLYQYEINKMKEIIEENKNKYNNIYKEINTISTSLKLTIKDFLIKFSTNINNFSDIFNNLYRDLKTNINLIIIPNNQLKANFHFSYDEPSNKEKNEIKEKSEIIEKSEIKEIKETSKFKIIKPKKRNTTPLFGTMNINPGKNKTENLSNVEYMEKIINNNKIFIDNIIKIIVGENEIKSREIIDLCDILAINKSKKDNIYVDFFLNEIKNTYNNRVFFLKNKNNFIHLSNIMNILCLNYKNNYNILNLIIEVSQMIKNKKEYIYKIIQKKNAFFSTKTFWLQLIDNDLIKALNIFVDNILINENKKNIKENFEDNKNYEIKDLNKKIINYKKLNNIQKKELFEYGKNKIHSILSKSIPQMCCFLVPVKIINEIIIYYGIQFKFEYEFKCYLKNIILIKNIRIKNPIEFCHEKDQMINNTIIYISSISKFCPIKDYLLFLQLNKKLYPKIKKNLFSNLLSDEQLSINSHLILLKEYLQIEKLKKKFKYKDIKDLIYISLDKDKIYEEIGEKTNINMIEKELLRTKFINQNKDHFKILKTILISFVFLFPKIGYCQGMNYIITFLYQLLDYDEEETFYFFSSFELNSKSQEIFKDNFNTLKIYFRVFEQILNINCPEIYYKFIDCNITSNSYFYSWFINLFSDYAYIFDKNNLPKFSFFIFEKFIIEGWPAIFNYGFSILEYCYDKLLIFDNEKLIFYITNILDHEDIIKNENFAKIKKLYMKNNKIINEFSINAIIDIIRYEENNKYLTETKYGKE